MRITDAEFGGDLSRSSGPKPLLRQGQLGQAAQHRAQLGSEYLHGWRLHNLSGICSNV